MMEVVVRYLITFFLVIILIGGCKKEDSTPVAPVQDSPTVKIVTPINNQNILDSVTIQIEASDPKGVTKVELFIQNNKVKEFAIEPYNYFWDVKGLPDSSQYSIYAKAHNSDDKVTGSEVIKVTVNRLSPSNLQILSLTKDTVHLKWKDNSIVEESCVIQVSTDSVSFTAITELPANTTEAIISYSFSFGVKYYFRVGAKKSNNVSYSSVLSGGARPDTPELLSPQNNAIDIAKDVTFTWSASAGAENYSLQISTDSLFTSFVYNQSGLMTTSKQTSGLFYNTKYYWRVKANNSFASSNWTDIWCIITIPSVHTCGTPLTYSGKLYNTIQIGSQCWLKENLDIGTMIHGNVNAANNGVIEKYCFANNQANCNASGGLYLWNEAMQYVTTPGTKGICPEGWHIPTYAELQTLQSSVVNNSNVLKAVGQGSGSGAGTNTSGFSALLAGSRNNSGNFNDLGYFAYFWSSTEVNDTDASFLCLVTFDSVIYFIDGIKNYGFSVRCIMD